MLPPVPRAYRCQTLLDPFIGVGLATQQERERDVLARGQPRQQVEDLEDDPDPSPPELRPVGFGEPASGMSVNDDIALRGPVQAADQVEEGALPAAARSHDGQELPLGHLQRNPLHCADDRGAPLIDLGDSFQPDHVPSQAARPPITQRRESRQCRERGLTSCAGAVSKEENSRHAGCAGHDLALGLSHRLRGLQAASSGPPASLLLPGLLGDDPTHRWPGLPPVRTPVRLAARADLQSGTPLRPLPEKTSRVRTRPSWLASGYSWWTTS